jgi:hypothetical protein
MTDMEEPSAGLTVYDEYDDDVCLELVKVVRD